MNNSVEKPAIIVSNVDDRRLTALATDGMARSPEAAGELLAEMERAQIQAAQAMPATVVTMGSAVVFRSDDGRTRRVALVFPGQADIAQGRISILTPIGRRSSVFLWVNRLLGPRATDVARNSPFSLLNRHRMTRRPERRER